MEAKELRLGNYINYVTYKKTELSEVTASLLMELEPLSNSGSHDLYEPIPLTEEWLLKFDVIETKKQSVFRVNYVSYHKGSNTYSYCLCYYFDDQGYVDNEFIKIEYVHQLQNLYFALTNEELKII